MARRKHSAAQPTAEDLERRAAFEREWSTALRRAARICLDQSFQLVGQDMPFRATCAEQLVLKGTKRRFDTVVTLALCGATDEDLRRLVMGEGPHGSDRLAAVWWASLWIFGAGNMHRGDPDEARRAIERLCRPVHKLVADGILSSDAQEMLCGTEDVFLHARERARKEHAEFQASLKRMAGEG